MSILKDILRPIAVPVIEASYPIIGKFFPKLLVEIRYKQNLGKSMDWDNPKDINEKINWLKFNSDTSKWVLLADKYKVRDYVKECGLEDMLVRFYGKWDRAEDIDWDSLPSSFILKTNNGSGDAFVCKDKSKLDKKKATAHMKKALDTVFGNSMGEPHYNRIVPCIIAEELLDNNKQMIESSSLLDFKIWAFDGKPQYIWVCYNRKPGSVEVALYDKDWNFHPEYSVSTSHYILSRKSIPRPKSLDKMLDAAAKLSKGLPQARVDMYEVDGKPYFGEITLTSNAGYNNFYTEEFLLKLGELTVLDKA